MKIHPIFLDDTTMYALEIPETGMDGEMSIQDKIILQQDTEIQKLKKRIKFLEDYTN